MEVISSEALKNMSVIKMAEEYGIMNLLYYSLIKTGLLPTLIFMGVGAMTDFGPLLRNLRLAFFGAAAQLGIFSVLIAAIMFGFTPQEAGVLGIIGGADGPTAIYTSFILAPHLLGPIAIAAYSYMALVPVIIPLMVKLTTTEKELKINMKEQDKLYPSKYKIKNLKLVKILFPIALLISVSLLVPSSTPLLGMLLFGNLIKELGSDTSRLFDAASNTIMNAATIFLGLTIGATMTSNSFLNTQTLLIILGGFIAFAFSILGGIMGSNSIIYLARKKSIHLLELQA
jgi:oxaloacetate decarboxylase beta subunit